MASSIPKSHPANPIENGRLAPPFSGTPPGVPPVPPPPEERAPIRSRLSELSYYFRYLKDAKAVVALIVATAVSVNLFRVPISYIPMILTKHYDSPGYLYGFLLAIMACVVLMGVSMLLRGYYGSRLGEHLLRTIRQDLFAKLERLSMLSVYSRGTGPFTQRIARDVYYIRDLFNQTFIQVADESVRLIVCGAACLLLEPWLTVGLLGLFFLVWPFVRLVNNRVEKTAGKTRELGEEVLSHSVENIGGFREILASGRFDHFARKFGKLLKDSETYGVRTSLWEQVGGVMPRTWIGLLLVLPYVIAVGGLESKEDAGRVITFVLLIQQVLPVFGMLAQAASQLAIATPSMREVRNLLELEAQTQNGATAIGPEAGGAKKEIQRIDSIRFENVSLELGGRRILEDLSFEIPGGKMTAIIGQSGAGKTTLFHLLLRLVKPTSGVIYINEIPLDTLPDKTLREIVGFIPQNPFIFNQTLRENLMIASDGDGGDGPLARAIEISQLADVVEIRKSEGGLDATAGYMGAKLSGGEKQRVALARLILRDPEAIVCDEYTANIDVKTARLIHETIRSVFADRTRVLITHELYTIKGADRIIVLDRGRVAQTGTHEDLVDKPGLYRDLWEVQNLG